MVEELITKFQRSGLLNDEAYTGGIVSSYRRRGLSKQAILSRLKARGIETAQGLAALSAYDENNENSEITAALTYARKKRLGPFMTKEIDPEKQLASLARQGFSYDTAQVVLKMDKEEAEALLNAARL
jgi:regulatory protein